MSTHNIGFNEEISKSISIPSLSLNIIKYAHYLSRFLESLFLAFPFLHDFTQFSVWFLMKIMCKAS